MNNYDLLLSCISWEDRFIGGLEQTIATENVQAIQLFEIEEFLHRTASAKKEALDRYSGRFKIETLKLSMIDDTKSWKSIENHISGLDICGKKVLLDISTMPRFLIWFLLHFLQKNSCEIDYRYYSPLRYGDCSWLSGEPEDPRLVFKHSGIHLPDKSTALIIQSGFDTERVSQLLNMYEPQILLLAAQSGSQYSNLEKNIKKHREKLSFPEIESFEVDAFSTDHGLSAILEKVEHLKEDHNIIMSSFGPKPLAITMHRINNLHPEAGLVYVPASDYNIDYSKGTDLTSIQSGTINFP